MGLNDVKIKTKILGGALLLVLITVIFGILAFVYIGALGKSTTEITDNYNKAVETATEVEREAFNTMLNQKNFIININDAAMNAKYADLVYGDLKKVLAALDAVEAHAKEFDDTALGDQARQARKATQDFEAEFRILDATSDANTVAYAEMGTIGNEVGNAFTNYINAQGQTLQRAIDSDDMNLIRANNNLVVKANEGIDYVNLIRLNVQKYIVTGDKAFLKAANDGFTKLLPLYDELYAMEDEFTQKEMIRNTKEISIQYRDALTEWASGDEKIQASRAKLVTLADQVMTLAREAESSSQEDVVAARESAASQITQANVIIISTIIIAVVLGVMIALFLARIITAPINKIKDEANKLAATGDLTMRATVMGSDEVGEMAVALNQMLDNTAGPVGELAKKAEIIASGDLTVNVDVKAKGDIVKLIDSFRTMVETLKDFIGNVSKNAQIAATSAEELSASSEEVNASMEQVNATVQELAKGAQNVTRDASDAENKAKVTAQSAQSGSASAKQVSSKMEEIRVSTQAGADKIKELGDKSKEIGNIVETINNISEQTNLLALNAAIEAARAGDAGRGFAVVADEVRKLAEESQKATRQISDLITGIQGEIGAAVMMMNDNNKKVEDGSKAVIDAVRSFDAIPSLVEDVKKALSEISSVAEENAAGSEELSSSAEQVSASMQQVSGSAQQLSKGAEDLRQLVSKFKVDAHGTMQENYAPVHQEMRIAQPVVKKTVLSHQQATAAKQPLKHNPGAA